MNDDRRLTLGVIGAGAWAAFAHIPGFLRRPEVTPLIVNRRDPVQLEALRERFGFERATTDWREVIEARPDMVALTGPVHLRAEQAKAALAAGIHVLAEKPFTVDPADAWAIHRLAQERGLHVVLCYAWNEMGISEAAHRLIHEDGGIGDIEAVSVEMSTIVRDLLTAGTTYLGDADVPQPRLETWADPSISGGGYGQGQLTHALGLVLRLVPQLQPQRIAAFTSGPGATRGAPRRAGRALRGRGHRVHRRGVAAARLVRQRAPAGHPGHRQPRPGHARHGRPAGRARPGRGARRGRAERRRHALVVRPGDRPPGRPRSSGRTTANPSPGDLGARVVEMLDGMYRSAASGEIATVSRS